MSKTLDQKIQELSNSDSYECWYLVKQPTDFASICYLVSFLEEYKEESSKNTVDYNLEYFISRRVEELKNKKELEISNNYRALRVAAFYGLIRMADSKYETAKITDAFYEIKSLTKGEYEKKELYQDVINRQIEKMFVSSGNDEECNGVRKNYRLFPVMLLYKILLELGKSNKSNYSISMTDYRYLVATTEHYEGYLDTLFQIIELNKNPDYIEKFEKFKEKFDNRMILALKQLDTLNFTNTTISISVDKIDEVTNKINAFERKVLDFSNNKYLEFLCSTKSFFDLPFKENAKDNNSNNVLLGERVKGGENILLYGVPGSGKSYTISKEYCNDESKIERIVFHPDYMNTDFIGQILPTVKDELITYDFTPGPFTRILKKAYNDIQHHYYLIIEEINRGNAPAIFGDVFQLLDRDSDGASSYSIKNYNVARLVYGDDDYPVSIPSNLSILATMNTADQNVFTLDTAFQRRWIMRLIKNDVMQAEHASIEIIDTGITWGLFNTTINKFILASNSSTMSSEDKRLGAYFITKDNLTFDNNMYGKYKSNREKDFHSIFAEKVIKYLWDDAFKFARNKLFNSNYRSLEKVIEDFTINDGFERFNIFTSEVINQLKNDSNLSEGDNNAEESVDFHEE